MIILRDDRLLVVIHLRQKKSASYWSPLILRSDRGGRCWFRWWDERDLETREMDSFFDAEFDAFRINWINGRDGIFGWFSGGGRYLDFETILFTEISNWKNLFEKMLDECEWRQNICLVSAFYSKDLDVLTRQTNISRPFPECSSSRHRAGISLYF